MSYIICGLWKLHITTRLWTPGAKVSSLGLNFFPLISAKTGMMPFLEAVSFISCPAAVALGSPWEPSNHQVGERRNWRVSPPHSPQITCTRLPHCWGTNRLHLLLGQKMSLKKSFYEWTQNWLVPSLQLQVAWEPGHHWCGLPSHTSKLLFFFSVIFLSTKSKKWVTGNVFRVHLFHCQCLWLLLLRNGHLGEKMEKNGTSFPIFYSNIFRLSFCMNNVLRFFPLRCPLLQI